VFAEIERVGGRGPRSAEFCRLLAFTGLRRGEARGLVVGDLDFARGIIHVRGTKTEGSFREVPMIPVARTLLATLVARRAEEAAETGVAHGPASRVLTVGEAQKSLDRACAAVGVPRLTHHDLRDAFATTCIEAGVDIPTVAAWLGHVDGGALLMRVYAHHRRKHSIEQAAKVSF
jgi:integrase